MVKKIKELPQIFTLQGYYQPTSILVVGCGGTGGHLVPHLARLVGVMREDTGSGLNLNLILADGDVVEKKNLVRQNFVASDIGKNKAEVMAARYSRAFGYEISAVVEDIENRDTINKLIGASGMVIGCVDNNASRRVINHWFLDGEGYYGKFWIDSGNEESAGQVVCGHVPGTHQATSDFCLPSVFEVFPDLMEDESGFNSQLSCAERAQSAPQNMQTNVTAATIIMNFVQKIMRQGQLKSHAVDFSIDNAFATRLNTKENLIKVAPNRRKRWEKVYE